MSDQSGDAGEGIRTRIESWLAESLPDFDERTIGSDHKCACVFRRLHPSLNP